MGRPVKSVYFGNRNSNGVGGEGVLYANVYHVGGGYFSANAAVTFSAPQITGGTTAQGTVTLSANGNVIAYTVTTAGTGYTSPPTMSITGANASPAFGNARLYGTGVTANAISMTAYLSAADGGSSAVASDITKQTGSKRYKVANAQGTGVVALVDNGSPSAGQGYIGATDSAGGTYYVYKLYGDTAFLTPDTGTQFAANTRVQWNITTPVADTSVTLSNN
jgi:hypothetical protein